MKKVLIVAAATGLMSLAACNTTPAANNTVENVADSLSNDAELLTNEVANDTGALLGNGTETLENTAGNVAE